VAGAIGGFTPQITGVGYGPKVLNGIAPRYLPEDIYAGALWGALQALNAGITTIADWAHNLQSAEHADANLRGLQDSRIRGYFLYGGPGPTSDSANPHPQDARRMRDLHFTGVNGRLHGYGPSWTVLHLREQNAKDFAFAREPDCRSQLMSEWQGQRMQSSRSTDLACSAPMSITHGDADRSSSI
jgi:cytosine/adenosine deaminase-related metal-dependent hydrolase